MRYNLLFDADDTLWENNIHYEQAIHDFITFLNHSQLSPEEVRAALDVVQRRMGYGSASFTRSLVETYRNLVEHEPGDEEIRRLHRFGEYVRAQPMQLLAGVRDTLDDLATRHTLFLLTKGEAEEQKLKVERSGIVGYFKRALIVQEKNVDTYHHVTSELQVDPRTTWMIGNSPRSDINPALSAGLNAVFIPHPHTWRLEHEEIQETGDGRLLMLSTFADLRDHF